MTTLIRPQKTMLNVKIDTKLKKKAQKLASSFGLPLSTIISRKLEEFIIDEKVIFEKLLVPNTGLKKTIKEAEKDIKEGNIGTVYNTVNDFANALSKK